MPLLIIIITERRIDIPIGMLNFKMKKGIKLNLAD